MSQGHQSGHQKADHGGKFCTVPHRVLASDAWRHLSMRARAALQIFQMKHNGFNNGTIGLGIKALSVALGDQNYGATKKAVAELIEHGFLECTSDANRSLARVREYRIAYINTGEAKRIVPASHDYACWRPAAGPRRKFGGAVSATRTPSSVTDTATKRKVCVTDTATTTTESCGFEGTFQVADTATHICNQSGDDLPGHRGPESFHIVVRNVDHLHAGPSLDELREWCQAVIAQTGYGGARSLSASTGIPEAILSKFRAGRSLPDRYRSALHTACARAMPHKAFMASRLAETAA